MSRIATAFFIASLFHYGAGETYDDDLGPYNIVCAYTLSGQYGFLQRLHFYATLAFAAIFPRSQWLVGAAFAAVMTYASVAAIHAALLAWTASPATFDLDIVGAWCILSPTTIILGSMMQCSPTLHNSFARPLLRIWSVLLTV